MLISHLFNGFFAFFNFLQMAKQQIPGLSVPKVHFVSLTVFVEFAVGTDAGFSPAVVPKVSIAVFPDISEIILLAIRKCLCFGFIHCLSITKSNVMLHDHLDIRDGFIDLGGLDATIYFKRSIRRSLLNFGFWTGIS